MRRVEPVHNSRIASGQQGQGRPLIFRSLPAKNRDRVYLVKLSKILGRRETITMNKDEFVAGSFRGRHEFSSLIPLISGDSADLDSWRS